MVLGIILLVLLFAVPISLVVFLAITRTREEPMGYKSAQDYFSSIGGGSGGL